MFKEKVNKRTAGRTHEGQQTMTQARWPMASGAKKVQVKPTFFSN